MQFDFSPEQYALRDLARDLFEKESPTRRLREIWEGAERDPKVWRSMGEVGLLGVAIPEAHGGTGGSEVDLALVLEEVGRAALPEPFLETVAIAAPLLADAGATTWLPRIASGDAVVSVLVDGAPFAVDADAADLLVIERDGALHALERGRFVTTPVEAEDRARRLYRIRTDLTPDTRLDARPDVLSRAHARAAAATAHVLIGVAMRLLELTLEYVKSRRQFGREVGSFQAVKHRLADAQLGISSARAASWYAAYALAEGLPDAALAAAVAKAAASDAEAAANAAALQAHGGIGYTWEHDLHLWLKRGKALEQSYGSPTEHRRTVAAHLFEKGTSA